MDRILEEAGNIFNEIVEIRHEIHRHPELGNQETRTSALIREKLREYGVDEILSPTVTGVIAVIKGTKGPGKCVGLRCDMDALPVQEETGLPFSSEVSGAMHACGHDIHTSMMLGNAKILCGMRDQFAGTVKLIFEPSEEIHPGGARAIIRSGMVDDVDCFFGMHVYPTEGDVGRIMLIKGPATTSADVYTIDVHGKSGHGSEPHRAIDAILAACQVNVLLQQIQARNVDPSDVIIMTTNTIHGGIKDNVIPGECRMVGVIRAFTQETRELAARKLHDICRGVELISGCTIDDKVNEGYDPCTNDAHLVDLIRERFTEKLGGGSYIMMEKPQGFSEDFSFFSTMTGKPSVVMFLCAGHADNMPVSTLHSGNVTFNESAMPYGMAAMVNSALAALEE